MRTDDEARALLAEQPLPANPWVTVGADAILIRAGYNEAMQRMLRWVPGARWRAELRCWSVPLGGAELVRSVLPELTRLAEAMQEERAAPSADQPQPGETAEQARARGWFRDAARALYGSDWQRDTARALQRDESSLACWLAGLPVAEAPHAVLLGEMQALMLRRSAEIRVAAALLTRQISSLPPELAQPSGAPPDAGATHSEP